MKAILHVSRKHSKTLFFTSSWVANNHSVICDDCNVELKHRKDDNAETYERRYNAYLEETAPLIEYYEKKSIIIKNGKRFNVYHVYTPSHELKTDEFAILLDGLVQECEQQGIETRSPEQIERDSKLYGI